jgi:outer membrane protein TolC
LDEAIRIALQNSEVVRVIAGDQAVSSGATVYDPAAAATRIDQQRARFDPALSVSNTFNQLDNPAAYFDFTTPALASIGAFKIQDYTLQAGVTQATPVGGTAGVQVGVSSDDFGGVRLLNPDNPFTFPIAINPLDPSTRTAVEFSYVQPLLQGAWIRANVAPIVIAQLDTEISYYQLKRSVQELVRSTIEAYWGLVAARVDAWIRRQQVKDTQFAYERAAARQKRGLADASEVAQTRAAFATFRANLITAEGELLQREAVLRNVLGLPPADDVQLMPVTQLATQEASLDWDQLVAAAESQRPDVAERKLAVEAAEQYLILARNTAWPRVDLVGQYRMNGLGGISPTGRDVSSSGGQYTDWTLGINASMPLRTRQVRSDLRRQELELARQRANLQQKIHEAVHQLGTSYRRTVQFFEEYQAFREAREAAQANLQDQTAEYHRGRTFYLNVLQAISGWGDAVTSEARALARYNLELANLERDAGTILEFHGIELLGHNYISRGPFAPFHAGDCYPNSTRPSPNTDRYSAGTSPAETQFDSSAARPEPRPAAAPPQPGQPGNAPGPGPGQGAGAPPRELRRLPVDEPAEPARLQTLGR